MKLDKQLNAIKKKIVGPKFYVIELVCGTTAYLGTCITYSLEEAIVIARKQFTMMLKEEVNPLSIVLGKYAVHEVEDIIRQSVELVNNDIKTDKNALMKKIVETKDAELYAANVSIFNDVEKKYLLEKMSLKKP